jgi:hypothetical protein
MHRYELQKKYNYRDLKKDGLRGQPHSPSLKLLAPYLAMEQRFGKATMGKTPFLPNSVSQTAMTPAENSITAMLTRGLI